ncbi:hypothetical protein [Streptomyces sp. CHA3]|uniref:hypothetical protein n=1 Tax=Streptomyces sp. CHA3 TaxID=2841669 RepID=UPI002095D1DA|nr:hypothetical protein [Streptomyces sp. CHA3]MCO6706432.1 hypothetical protein [Streptomyces sp. CHA3]
MHLAGLRVGVLRGAGGVDDGEHLVDERPVDDHLGAGRDDPEVEPVGEGVAHPRLERLAVGHLGLGRPAHAGHGGELGVVPEGDVGLGRLGGLVLLVEQAHGLAVDVLEQRLGLVEAGPHRLAATQDSGEVRRVGRLGLLLDGLLGGGRRAHLAPPAASILVRKVSSCWAVAPSIGRP